jgi:hypothetical protein
MGVEESHIPTEYACLQKQTHRVNPVKWNIQWSKTKSDKDGYTILYIEFTNSLTYEKRYRKFSLRFINDIMELEQRMGDLCDKYYYEMNNGI